MALLDDLPSEILIEILSSLSNADLARTSLLSRYFHTISVPQLYKAPSLTDSRDSMFRQSHEIFLETLLTPSNTMLATHVRSLTWNRSGPEPSRDLPSYTALLSNVGSRLNYHLPYYTPSEQLVLLLHLLPRLHVLKISPPRGECALARYLELHYTSGSIASTIPVLGLRSLREFHGLSSSGTRDITFKMLMGLLSLPHINYINACIRCRIYDLHEIKKNSFATSTIRKLRLSGNDILFNPLKSILKVPIALTHFSYTPINFKNGCNLITFMSMLDPIKCTVQYLHLDFKFLDLPGRRFFDTPAGGALRGWTALHTLSCSMRGLVSDRMYGDLFRLIDTLPPSIQELEIQNDCHWSYVEVVDQVVQLLSQKQVLVPRLGRLAIATDKSKSLYALEWLKAATDDADVTIVQHSLCW